jgi:hypothetical protein
MRKNVPHRRLDAPRARLAEIRIAMIILVHSRQMPPPQSNQWNGWWAASDSRRNVKMEEGITSP